MNGRTLKRWARMYVDGYDMSGYTREIGPLAWTYDEVEQVALMDAVRGALPDHPEISIGTLNGIFDNTAISGIHAVLGSAGVSRDVLVALGIQAAPAEGDPVFIGAYNQLAYQVAPSGGDVALTVPFGKTSPAEALLYEQPWGVLLHENSAEADVNAATGIDDAGASSSAGGYLMYHILDVEGTGDVTIKIEEADTNTDISFGDLTDATSGEIAHTAIPCSGIVQLGKTADIKQYLRWQIVLDGITSCTFVLGFVRGR
jgi:hypothetical protein